MRAERNAGFALLEAIVALAILAAAGLALFAALTQSLRMVDRADSARERVQLMRNALAMIDTINPMERESGSAEIGEYTLTWHATPLEPPQDGANGTLAPGLYLVGLYKVDCKLTLRGARVQDFSVRQAGYRQVRQPPVLQL
ncbi:MAG: hypothetical protein JSS25_11645 [Proteobacteria bacterium]|nr:hypothetical protein [Pseudomonadota bacterium]